MGHGRLSSDNGTKVVPREDVPISNHPGTIRGVPG
jgi:hypothetical protein